MNVCREGNCVLNSQKCKVKVGMKGRMKKCFILPGSYIIKKFSISSKETEVCWIGLGVSTTQKQPTACIGGEQS